MPKPRGTPAAARLPAVPARHAALGQKNPRQAALLRPVGRPGRRPGQVPRPKRGPARRPDAARAGRRLHGPRPAQPLPNRQAPPTRHPGNHAPDLRRLPRDVRPSRRVFRVDAAGERPGVRRLRPAAFLAGQGTRPRGAGQRDPACPHCLQVRVRRRADRPGGALRPRVQTAVPEGAAEGPGVQGAAHVPGRRLPALRGVHL
jgi:hypothetical protein